MAGLFTNNWGEEWDSTLLWYDDFKRGYFPQGGIFDPGGGASYLIRCSNIVACGGIKHNNSYWDGSFFATKRIDYPGGTGNTNTTSSATGSLEYYDHSQEATWGNFDFPVFDFTITEDQVAHALGVMAVEVKDSVSGWSGASIINRQMVHSSSTWRADTIIPHVKINSGGKLCVQPFPHMAWNQDGDVGYVWFIGVRQPRPGMGDTMANMGMQPIVYKTIDRGLNWNELPRINFNEPSGKYDPVLRPLDAANGGTWKIPYFNDAEGIDGVVDRNNRLHLVATVLSTMSNHNDSLVHTRSYLHNDGEVYKHTHVPGYRNYIYDFTETGNGWNVTLIDSIQTEVAGDEPGEAGYGNNLWDTAGVPDKIKKCESGARIQLSRTPDGKHIVYTWAESDTQLTFLARKWNDFPDVKARLGIVSPETTTLIPAALSIHSLEINVTNPTTTVSPPYAASQLVKNRAYIFHAAPTCALISPSNSTQLAIGLPIVVSTSNILKLNEMPKHYFLPANLNFDLLPAVEYPSNIQNTDDFTPCDVGVDETDFETFKLFPNPSGESVKLWFNKRERVQVELYDLQSHLVWCSEFEGVGTEIPVESLPAGVYMIKLNGSSLTGTRKLIVQH